MSSVFPFDNQMLESQLFVQEEIPLPGTAFLNQTHGWKEAFPQAGSEGSGLLGKGHSEESVSSKKKEENYYAKGT